VQALRERYARLEARASADGRERWLNWAIRLRDGGALAGYVQATVLPDGRAWIAFVLGTAYQGHGLALEATTAMVDELRVAWGVRTVLAGADADNAASIRLMQRLGLREQGDARERAALGIARGDVLYTGLL
jgi:RimJ/RimL family protein N-acetyltransferase